MILLEQNWQAVRREAVRPACAGSARATARRGISLLEVLLSMFILTVGLLGVAALIPVGRYDLNQAAQADRGSTVGRAAFREVQVRGMLDPAMWLSPSYDRSVPENPWFDVDEIGYADVAPEFWLGSPLLWGNSICIDPLYVARAQALDDDGVMDPIWPARAFPYPLDNDPAAGAVPRMSRATLKAWDDQSVAPLAWPLGLPVTDRVFRWQDDIVFNPVTGDEEGRPAQVFDATSTPQYLGDYSWLVTLTPDLDWRSAADGNFRPRNYTASVVVFNRRTIDLAAFEIADRDGELPTERAVLAEFPYGPGMGVVDVVLRLPADNENALGAGEERSDFPAVKAGQWILMCGWTRSGDTAITIPYPTDGGSPPLAVRQPTIPRSGPAGSPSDRLWATFRWYRVASAGELTAVAASGSYGDEWRQNVTLAGPPLWLVDDDATPPVGFLDAYFDADSADPDAVNGDYPTLHAVIVDGVVEVYEKTVRLSK